ncbi:MAG TPA: TIGR04283 family arsenosugar biosynthesis glycosyltransferase [Hyphomicrobiaceae bacterium]|nr:TIGR04283 family arsenosugar biosynthesis glycosyltransferase [Hyphomicrobiaceae bacterium]
MISVIIPTLDAQDGLAATLTALVPAVVEGLVREVIVVDGGSADRSVEIADQAGCTIVRSERGRGQQLATGAAAARHPWLLFLHADTILEQGWERDGSAFIERIDSGLREPAAAAFRFALDDLGIAPRILEAGVAARCALFRLPYGDQGLLIPKRLYDRIGGFSKVPLMEDVELVGRLKRSQLIMLRARAITSAIRYRRDGYLRRTLRNLSCLTLYYLRVPPGRIVRWYR